MKNNNFLISFLCACVSFSIIYSCFSALALYSMRKTAVDLNHAEYNPKTGRWQWITNNYVK